MWTLTKHARRRLRQRNLGGARLRRAARGKKQSRGGGVYRAETEERGVTTVVVYKRKHGKRVLLSAWKQRTRR